MAQASEPPRAVEPPAVHAVAERCRAFQVVTLEVAGGDVVFQGEGVDLRVPRDEHVGRFIASECHRYMVLLDCFSPVGQPRGNTKTWALLVTVTGPLCCRVGLGLESSDAFQSIGS